MRLFLFPYCTRVHVCVVCVFVCVSETPLQLRPDRVVLIVPGLLDLCLLVVTQNCN